MAYPEGYEVDGKTAVICFHEYWETNNTGLGKEVFITNVITKGNYHMNQVSGKIEPKLLKEDLSQRVHLNICQVLHG